MIINDDILNWCKEYKGEKFHSLICDPPYHLVSIEKRLGNAKEENEHYTNNTIDINPYSRLAKKGFMGKSWDGGDIAFRKETWEALKEHFTLVHSVLLLLQHVGYTE